MLIFLKEKFRLNNKQNYFMPQGKYSASKLQKSIFNAVKEMITIYSENNIKPTTCTVFKMQLLIS